MSQRNSEVVGNNQAMNFSFITRVDGLAERQFSALKHLIHQLKDTIVATTQEANTKLDALGASLDKISAETTALVTEVRELKEAAAGNVPDDIMAKIDALTSKAEGVDAQVDDVAPNPTPTPEPEEPAEPPAPAA